jgi:hypothetical protein
MFCFTEEEKKIVQERTKDNAVVNMYQVKLKHVCELSTKNIGVVKKR